MQHMLLHLLLLEDLHKFFTQMMYIHHLKNPNNMPKFIYKHFMILQLHK